MIGYCEGIVCSRHKQILLSVYFARMHDHIIIISCFMIMCCK